MKRILFTLALLTSTGCRYILGLPDPVNVPQAAPASRPSQQTCYPIAPNSDGSNITIGAEPVKCD